MTRIRDGLIEFGKRTRLWLFTYRMELLAVLGIVVTIGLAVIFQPQENTDDDDSHTNTVVRHDPKPPTEPDPPPPSEPDPPREALAATEQCSSLRISLPAVLTELTENIGHGCIDWPQARRIAGPTCSEADGVVTIDAQYRLSSLRRETNSIVTFCYRHRGEFNADLIGYSVDGDLAQYCRAKGIPPAFIRDQC